MTSPDTAATAAATAATRHMRFHLPIQHTLPVFGNDWFALKAEAFARFFGTPLFLISQTMVVAVWIFVNEAGLARFDAYPFILLNLAFSLQAAYAAPLILLAQTRQADRDRPMPKPMRCTAKTWPGPVKSASCSPRDRTSSCCC